MTDAHGQPLVGEPSIQGLKPFLRWLVRAFALLVGLAGMLTVLGAVLTLAQGDPAGSPGIIVGVGLLCLALLTAVADFRKASALRRQRQAEARSTRIESLERELGTAN